MDRLYKDIVTFLILAGGEVFLYIKSLQFPQGANIFPQFLIIALGVLTVVMLGQRLVPILRSKMRRGTLTSRFEVASGSEKESTPEEKRSWTPYLLVGGGVLYLVAINLIGFFVTSVLFMTVAMYLFGFRRYWVMAVSELILLAFIYVVFVMELHVPLPSGVLV